MMLRLYLFCLRTKNALTRYKEILNKTKKVIGKKIDSNPGFTEISKDQNEILQQQNNINSLVKAPKEEIKFICLTSILTDCIFKLNENYCPKVFLEECIYKIKEKDKNSSIEMI